MKSRPSSWPVLISTPRPRIVADLARDHVLGHAEVGQAHLEHAAGQRQGLEDGHREARESQLIGALRPAGPAPTTATSWSGSAAPAARPPQATRVSPMKRLTAVTATRGVELGALAHGLAGMVADASADAGEGVALHVHGQRVLELAPGRPAPGSSHCPRRPGRCACTGALTSASHGRRTHFFSRMCSSYSSRKYLKRREHGVGRRLAKAAQEAVLDRRGQLLERLDVLHLALARADAGQDLQHALGADRGRGRTCRTIRPGVKSRKKRAKSTMQVVSSMTIRPPEPMMAPASFSES